MRLSWMSDGYFASRAVDDIIRMLRFLGGGFGTL
jgi:hypothetical protein